MWIFILFWLNSIREGDLEQLKRESIKNWNIYDENKMTPLMYASYYNRSDIINFLLKNGANPCLKNGRGLDSLLISLESKRDNASEILINKCSKKNSLWLYYAIIYENYAIAEKLIDSGTLLNWKINGVDILSIAIMKGKKNIVQKLLIKGFNLKKIPKNGKNPLSIALQNGDVDFIKFLLESGADPNIKDSNGETTLNHSAVFKGDLEIIELLLKFGANPLEKGFNGDLPILKATQQGKLDIVKLLLKYGGEEINNSANMNALYYSVFNKEIFNYFVEQLGDKILEKGSNKHEPFQFHIARYLSFENLEKLPKNWFKISDKGLLNENYLTVTISSGVLEKVEYFYNLFPELINLSDFSGRSPLIHAVNINNQHILRYLLENGAKDNITFENRTAFQLALDYKLDRLIYIFLEYN